MTNQNKYEAIETALQSIAFSTPVATDFLWATTEEVLKNQNQIKALLQFHNNFFPKTQEITNGLEALSSL